MDIEKTLKEGLASVKDGLAEQTKALENRYNALEEQVKLSGEADEATKSEIKNLEEVIASQKERIEAIEKGNNRLGSNGKAQSLKSLLADKLNDSKDQIEAFKAGQISGFTMETKAIIGSADSVDAYTGDVVPADYVPGFKFDPERRVHVRQFLPVGTTNSDKIRFIKESNFTDNTGVTAQAIASGQNDFDLTATDAVVEKISAHFRVSKEALNDTAGLASHISLRGMEKYMKAEDAYNLYDSTYGLTVTSTDYTLDSYIGDTDAQEYDVLLEAIKQIRNRNFQPSAVMMSIGRYFDMIRNKDSEGRYIFPQDVIFGTRVPSILGVPVIATNAINDTDGDADDFLVADFAQLCTLFDRESVSVRFYEQDQDNAIKDLVTVQVAGRLALPTYLPNAGAFGNFTTAIQNAGNS
jgi:HK97 family phage major capsid protein